MATASSLLHPFAWLTAKPRRLLDREVAAGVQLPWPERVVLGVYLFWRELWEGDLTSRAAATSYVVVFSLIPLLTTTLAFFTAFPGLAEKRAALSQALFDRLLPGAVQSVQEYINQFSERAAATGAVSTLVFFVVILLLFQSVEQTFNRIWKVERERTWSERVKLLALFFVVGALAVTAMFVVSAEADAWGARHPGLTDRPAFSTLLLHVGNIGAAWAVFVVVSKYMPNAHVRWRAALLGGVIAGTVWTMLKAAFTFYVLNLASYQSIYGALGVVPAFFLWVYLTVLLLLIGATITFVVQNLTTLAAQRRREGAHGPKLAFHAVAVMATLSRAFGRGEAPVTAFALAERLHLAEYVVSQALQPLVAGGAVLLVTAGQEPRYALARPASSLSVGKVVSLATGEDLCVPETDAPTPLHTELARLFQAARADESSALERVTIDDLAAQAPDPDPIEAAAGGP